MERNGKIILWVAGLFALALFLVLACEVSADEFVVESDGSGDYPTIQDAIDNSDAGDTVFVRSGTYNENIVIDRSVHLRGIGTPKPIINGGYTTCIDIEASDNVTVSNFMLIGWKDNMVHAAIYVQDSRDCTIENNIIAYQENGVIIRSSTAITMKDNVVTGCLGIGLLLTDDSEYNTISGNHFDFTQRALKLFASNNNTIWNNSITDTTYGIQIVSSGWNVVGGGTMTGCDIALEVSNGRENILRDLYIYDSDYGVCVSGGSGTTYIENPTISRAASGAILLENAAETHISGGQLDESPVAIKAAWAINEVHIDAVGFSANGYNIMSTAPNKIIAGTWLTDLDAVYLDAGTDIWFYDWFDVRPEDAIGNAIEAAWINLTDGTGNSYTLGDAVWEDGSYRFWVPDHVYSGDGTSRDAGEIQVVVSDGVGVQTASAFALESDGSTLLFNYPPEAVPAVESITFSEDLVLHNALDLDDLFRDLDSITYSVSSSEWLTATVGNGNIVDLVALPDWYGSAELNITATDSYGEATPLTVTVNVLNAPDIECPEDAGGAFPARDYFAPGLDRVTAEGNEHVSVHYDTSTGSLVFVPEADWYGHEEFVIIAAYETTYAPPAVQGFKDEPTTFLAQPVGITEKGNGVETGIEMVEVAYEERWANVTVLPVNDPPMPLDPPQLTLDEDTTISGIDISPFFIDIDSDTLTYYFSSETFDTSVTGTMLSITPQRDYSGEGSLTIYASDGEFTVSTNLSIQVLPTPDISFEEDGAGGFNALDYFAPGFDELTWTGAPGLSINADPDTWECTISGKPDWHGEMEIIFSAHYHVDFEPTWAMELPIPGEFAFDQNIAAVRALDKMDGLATKAMSFSVDKTASVLVEPVNDAPAAFTIPTLRFDEDTTSDGLDLSLYFSDVDGDPLTYGIETEFESWQEGNVIYLSAPGDFNGAFDAVVWADDGEYTTFQEVRGRVYPVNDPPTPYALPSISIREDTTATLDLKEYFHDKDSVLSYGAYGDSTGVMLTVGHNGVLTIIPQNDFNGMVWIFAEASDGQYTVRTSTRVEVLAANDAPVYAGGLESMQLKVGKSSKAIDLDDYFSDPDGDALSFFVDGGSIIDAELDAATNELVLTALDGADSATSVSISASDGSKTIDVIMTIYVIKGASEAQAASPLNEEELSASQPITPVLMIGAIALALLVMAAYLSISTMHRVEKQMDDLCTKGDVMG